MAAQAQELQSRVLRRRLPCSLNGELDSDEEVKVFLNSC